MTCLEHLSSCEVEFLDLKVSSEAKWIVLLASWPSTGPSLIPTPPYRAADIWGHQLCEWLISLL